MDGRSPSVVIADKLRLLRVGQWTPQEVAQLLLQELKAGGYSIVVEGDGRVSVDLLNSERSVSDMLRAERDTLRTRAEAAEEATRWAQLRLEQAGLEIARLRGALIRARGQIEDVAAMPTDTDWIGRVLRGPEQ